MCVANNNNNNNNNKHRSQQESGINTGCGSLRQLTKIAHEPKKAILNTKKAVLNQNSFWTPQKAV